MNLEMRHRAIVISTMMDLGYKVERAGRYYRIKTPEGQTFRGSATEAGAWTNAVNSTSI